MTNENKEKYKMIVNGIKVRGMTNIGKAMEKCLNIIKDKKHKNEITSIFLMSDGQDTCGNN